MFSRGCRQNVSWSGCHLKAGSGLEDPLPRWLAQMVGKLVLAVLKPSLLLHVALSIQLLEQPRNMAAGFPQSKGSERTGGSHSIL